MVTPLRRNLSRDRREWPPADKSQSPSDRLHLCPEIGIALDNRVLTPLANLFYLRLRRGTPVTFAQARRYTPLLTGPQWYPMKELNSLAPEQRLPFLEQMLARRAR